MRDIKWPPKSPEEVARRRARMLMDIKEDFTGQLIKGLWAHYSRDYVAFINDWMYTYDPRIKTGVTPFLLFPRQAEYIRWLKDRVDNQEDCVTEKSRDMGVTWLCCAFAVCDWLFAPGSKIGFGSRKEDLVDKLGDPDTIFEKIRFILRYIPQEFLPTSYNEKTDAPHLKIINRENGSTIVGEGGDNIGRGGRNKMYFKDESAFYARPQKIDAALSQNSPCKIDVSTPNGAGNAFYEKAHNPALPKFTFHWKDDPRKDEDWYKKQCALLPPFIVAQELDIDYHASLQGVVIPAKYIRAAVGLELPADGAKKAGLDVADEEGKDTNALCLGQGVVIKSITEWNGINTTLTGRRAWREAKDFGADVINYDSIGVGAGVRGEFNELISIERHLAKGEGRTAYRPTITPVNTALPPDKGQIIPGKQNKDQFASLKSQYWWAMRRRFEKTYEHVNNIAKHPVDELISLPKGDNDLVGQLSQATYSLNSAGRIVIDKKGDGTKSPNRADALLLYFVAPKVVRVL